MGLKRISGHRNGRRVGVEPQLSLCTTRPTSSASPLSSSLSSHPSCSLSDSPSPSSSPLVSPSTPKTVAPRRGLAAWLVDQVESGKYPGLVWDDLSHTMFRIPWKHAGKQNYHQGDGAIFKAWAVYRGRFHEGAEQADPPGWKTRLRCALNKSPELCEVTSRSQMDISHPYKVYHIVTSLNVLHGHKLGVFCTQNDKAHLVSSPQQHLVAPAVQNVLPPSFDSLSTPTSSTRLPVPIPAINSISTTATPAETTTARSSPVPLSSLLNDHELPPNIIADVCKQRHWLDVTVAYRGRPLLLERVYAPHGFRLLPPGSTTIVASNGPKLIPLPSVDNLTTPRLRESAETLVRFVTGGVNVWLKNGSARDCLPTVLALRHCRAQVFFAGGIGLSSQPGQATKLQRGVETTIFDPHVFKQRLQQFADGWGPAPTLEAVLCLGEAFTPGDGRRRLITIHGWVSLAELQHGHGTFDRRVSVDPPFLTVALSCGSSVPVKPVYAELLLNEISNHVTDGKKHSQPWPVSQSPIATGAPSPPDTPPHPMDIGKCPPIPLSMNTPSKFLTPMPPLASQDCKPLIGSELPSSPTSKMVRCSTENGIQFGEVPTLSVITFAPAPSLAATPRSTSSVPRSSLPSPPHSPPFSSMQLVRKQPPFGTQLLVLKAKPMAFTLAHHVFLSSASRIPTSKVLQSTVSEAGELPVSLANLFPSSPADSSPLSLDNHVTPSVANHPALTQAIHISVTDNHLACPSSQVPVTSIRHLPSPSTKEALPFPPTQTVFPRASKSLTLPPPVIMLNSNLCLATSAATFLLHNSPPIFSTAPSNPSPPNPIPPMPSLIVSVIPCLPNVPQACSTKQEASSPSKPNPPETG